MSRDMEPASSCWEVERRSCGQVFRPYYVVVLRNKKKRGKSVVKATSSDAECMTQCVDELKKDLYELTNDAFVRKYQLGSAV